MIPLKGKSHESGINEKLFLPNFSTIPRIFLYLRVVLKIVNSWRWVLVYHADQTLQVRCLGHRLDYFLIIRDKFMFEGSHMGSLAIHIVTAALANNFWATFVGTNVVVSTRCRATGTQKLRKSYKPFIVLTLI